MICVEDFIEKIKKILHSLLVSREERRIERQNDSGKKFGDF